MNQLDRIMEFTGRPSQEDIEATDSPFAATMMESCTVTQAKRLTDMFPMASPEAADLLRSAFESKIDWKQSEYQNNVVSEIIPWHHFCSPPAYSGCRKLLVFNPNKRLSPEQALKHPYVAQFHNSADEPSAGKVFVLPISDNTKYTVAEYR